MFLGIEIGGTKLQLAVGAGNGEPLAALCREQVEPDRGAEGIRAQIVRLGEQLCREHAVEAVGVGFGGPVDPASGRTITSHQVSGWDDFDLVGWCRDVFHKPAGLMNDSDAAGLAEARFGAGQGARIVLYSNVGSGIGGAIVIDDQVHTGAGGVAAEIGQLRPGPKADRPDATVESIASGWAITVSMENRLMRSSLYGAEHGIVDSVRQDAADLASRCDRDTTWLSTKIIAEAAAEGNVTAWETLDHAIQTYGWAIAQVVTVLAPETVVIGGGVSCIGEQLFFRPLRHYVRRYVFPPLVDSYKLVPAALGEEVVLHGALAVAHDALSRP